MVVTVPHRATKRPKSAEKQRSEQILARADAVGVLIDQQLKRLQAAAELYRQRLEGNK